MQLKRIFVGLDMMDARYLNHIKTFEGFTREATWDYAQYSNGYGTKAAYKGEVIGRDEADRRFGEEIKKAGELVDNFSPGLDSGSRAALVSLTFNAGTKWMRSGLGEAVKTGDLEDAKKIFLQYTKAGGVDLPGLQKRRLEEATWFQADRVQEVASNDLATVPQPDRSDYMAAETPASRGHSGLPDADQSQTLNAAHEIFEQIKMDRIRLLVLSGMNDGSRGDRDA